jgi:putative ABC transport system permease protein
VADDVNTPVVMISFDLWQSQFGGDAGIVGRRLTRFGQPHEIIGVLPRGFRLLSEPDAVTLLDPRQLRAEARTFYYYWVIGRLRDDVSFADARRDLDGVMSDVAAQHVQVQGWSASIDLLGDALAEPVRPSLLVVAAIAALVLIVGIGNAANLVASHALARRRDMAIRLALGASPGRVRRQWFFEGCLIALGGTGLGVLVLAASLAPLAAYLPQSASIRGSAATVELAPLAAGPITLAVAFLLCACVGLLLGALPIRQPGLVDIGTATPRAPVMLTRERRWLLAAQSAVATLLTAVTGLLLVMVIQLRHTSPGFDASEVTALGIGGIHELDVAARARYYTQVIDAVSRVPGVMAVGLNDYVPLTNEDDYEGFEIPGRPRVGASWPREEWRRVSAGYFTAMRIPILSGRALTPADDERAASVVVINETMARKYWPGVDPVGTRIRITNARHGWSEIVGVAGDVREVALDAPAKPMMFVSYHRDPRPVMALFVKTMGRPDLAAAAVRAAIWSADPTRPLFGEATLSQIVGDSYVVQRSLLNVAAALASLALLLIAGGTYAVVALVTLGRVRELAVRIALGAGPLDVVSAVVARPCAWVGAGIAAGLAGAAIAAPVIGSQLASVPSFDARIALATGTIVALIIAAACVAPLARALRTDAATTLRSE